MDTGGNLYILERGGQRPAGSCTPTVTSSRWPELRKKGNPGRPCRASPGSPGPNTFAWTDGAISSLPTTTTISSVIYNPETKISIHSSSAANAEPQGQTQPATRRGPGSRWHPVDLRQLEQPRLEAGKLLGRRDEVSGLNPFNLAVGFFLFFCPSPFSIHPSAFTLQHSPFSIHPSALSNAQGCVFLKKYIMRSPPLLSLYLVLVLWD